MNMNTWNGWKHSTVGQWIHGMSLGLMLWMVLIAPTQVLAAPTGAQVVQGNVNIQQSGSTTNITASNNAIINYNQFNIAANETVRFVQPNSSARVLNRVVGDDPSQLLGNLQANGIVYLVNPSGVYFGQNCVIDAADFRAAAGRISNQDFLAGMDRFQLTGELVNDGTITASAVTLLGRQVTNTGTIVARQGAVTLAAGEGTIVLTGDGRYVVEVAGEATPEAPQGDAEAAVVNEGEIRASRMVSLFSAGDTFSLAVKQEESGTIESPEVAVTAEAGSVQIEGGIDAGYEGQIVIWAEGVTQMSGTLLADGGFVEVSGEAGVELDGTVMTGPAGTLLIDPTVIYVTSQGTGPEYLSPAQIDQMLIDNGTVTVQADNLIEVQESITSSAPGTLRLWASDPINGLIRMGYDASILMSGGANIVLEAGAAVRGDGNNAIMTNGAGTITLVGNASNAGVAGMEVELHGGVSFSQGNITTDSGAISITGNGLQTDMMSMGGADGVFLDGGEIMTGSGDITITGTGHSASVGEYESRGVVLEGNMDSLTVSSSGGSVVITGTGGLSRNNAQGVFIEGDAAVGGNTVTITGRGGTIDASTGYIEDNAEGVMIDNYGGENKSKLSGGVGGITIDGTGGGYINASAMPGDGLTSGGVHLDGAMLATVGGGAIAIDGHVDDPLVQTQADGVYGVNIMNSEFGFNEPEITPEAYNITITGTGGAGQVANAGVILGDVDGRSLEPTLINTAGGDLLISSMMGGVALISTQIDTSGGNVTLTGTGGNGAMSGNMLTETPLWGDPSFGNGVQILGGTTINADAGNVTITGQGSGTAVAPLPGTVHANGVLIESDTMVSTGSISISGQNVTITGTGGGAHADAAGVQGGGDYTIAAAANVTIAGNAGTYIYEYDEMAMMGDEMCVSGVYMRSDIMQTPGGFGIIATSGYVTISGTGGHGDFSAVGAMESVYGASACGTELTDINLSAGGGIVLNGTGGNSFGSVKGVDVEGECTFIAGTNVQIAGTGGTYVYIPGEIGEGGGEISGGEMIVSGPSNGGASTTGVSFYNYMSMPGEYDVIATSGDVTITGTGGTADYSAATAPLSYYEGVKANGIEIDGTAFQAGGAIMMQGTGGDSSGDVVGVDMSGLLDAAGNVTISGTGGKLSCYGQPSYGMDQGFEAGGVLLEGQAGVPDELVIDAGGNVVLTGQGGSIDMSGLIVQASPEAVDYAIGVEFAGGLVQAGGNVTANGTGGTIDLTGMSPSGDPLDHDLRVQGVWVDEMAAVDTSAGPGAISLTGTGGTVNIDSAVGDTFVGEVGIEGVEIRGLVKSSTGAISMLGQGGAIEVDGLPIDPADPNLADMRWRGMNIEGQVVSTTGDVSLSGVTGDWLGDVAGVGLVGSPMPMAIATGGIVNIGDSASVGNGGGTISGSEIIFSDTLAIPDVSTLTLNGVSILSGDVVGPQGTLQLNGPDDATATVYLMGNVTLNAVGSGPGAYNVLFVQDTTVTQHAIFNHTGELGLGVEATPAYTIDFQNGFTYAGTPVYGKVVEDIDLGLIDDTRTIVVLPGQTVTSTGLDDDGNIKVITGSGGTFIVTGGAVPGAEMTLLGSGDATVQGPVDGTTIILGGSGERTFDQPVVDAILTDLGGNYDARFAGGSNFANPDAVLLGTTGSVDFGTDVVFVAGLSVPVGTVVVEGTLNGGTGGVEVGGLDMAGDTTILGQGDIAVAGQLTGLVDLVIVGQGDVLLQPTDTSEAVRSVFVEGVNIMSYGTDTLGGDQTYICSPDGSVTFHSTYDVGGGDFIMDTSRALPPALASAFKSGGDLIILNANNFTMTGNDKLTVGGNLEINAVGIASLGDINALGSILVNAGSIVLLERDAGMVQLPDGSMVMDSGLDFAAGGTITINGLTTGQSPRMNENLAMGSGDLFSPDGFAFDLAVLVPDPPKPGPNPDIESPEVLIYDESTIQQEAAESEITRLGDEVADEDGEGDEVVTDSNVTLTAAEVKAVLGELGIDAARLTTPASRAAAKQLVALYWTVFIQSGKTADVASVEKRNDGRINEVLAAALKNAGNLKSMDALQLKKALLARGQSSAIVMEYLASLYQTINEVELPAKKGYRMKWSLASRIAPSGVNSRTLMQAIETAPVANGQPERLKSLKKTLANNSAPTEPVAMVN